MRDLEGKVGVVTGGAGGIGKAIGVAMLAENMKVVLADVLDEQLQEAVQEIGSDDLIGVASDVTSYESMCALRDKTIETFGAVHVICNNAGVGSGAKGNMWEHHNNDWKWSIDVNVLGIVNGINAFVPTLVAQDEGHVVNTSSGNGGFTPLANSAIYAVTKAAVTCITECLWGQLHQIDSNVGVSTLYPSTKTPGVLATGIWNAGANRPDRYSRGDDPTEPARRDALAEYIARAKEAGQEVQIAPLSEVADLCVNGIKNDNFWATYPSERQADLLHARVESQINQTSPDYLLGANLMTRPAAKPT